ncbi:MAG: response regulator transcription factor [Bacteriovoracaceae bacterium]
MLESLKILLVEDEPNLGQTLLQYLNSIGMKTTLATTVKQAEIEFQKENYPIVLMDVGLPDGNGFDLAKLFRQKRKDFVLLFLSALNDPSIRVEGLEIGAEDFITKPFELKELILRLKRIIKTQSNLIANPDEIKLGTLRIWFKRFEVADSEGTILPLSQKECAILELLFKHKNEAVNREMIINEVWGEDQFPSNRTVDNYIVKLRKWSDTESTGKVKISSIRGIGYKLEIKE